MSTTKNEQHHILSPEWLRTNPLPEGDVFYRTKGYTHWCEFDRSFHRTDFMVAAQLNEYEFATQRTDLPPEAYITPPTDTTGSGREGETGCGPKSGHCAECGTTEGALVLLEDTTLCEECNMADHVVKLRLIDELTAQVEALRRKVAEQERELMDHAEDWAFSGIMPGSKLAGKLAEHDRKRKQEREDSALLDLLEQLATIRWPFGNTAMLAAAVEAKEPFNEKPTVRAILRAAIDSAQRQEGV